MDKKTVIDSINEMPANFELEELLERMILLEKIQKGQQDFADGKVHSHEEAREKLSKWLK